MKPEKILFGVYVSLLLANMAYILKRPFGSDSPDPFLKYLIIYAGIFGLLSYLYRVKITKAFQKFPTSVRFLTLSLTLVIIEEIVTFITKVGVFEGGQVELLDGLAIIVPSLFLWTVGILAVVKRYQCSQWQLFMLAAISAWIIEMIVVPKTLPNFLQSLFLFPSVSVSYLVQIWLPYESIKAELTSTRASIWKIPASILLPIFLFIIGAAFGQALVT